MKLTVRYAGLSDVGRVRPANEDNWIADPEQGLFIVADGMGGEFGGALASKVVVETLPSLVRQYLGTMASLPQRRAERRMAKAIATLSTQMRQQTESEPGLAGMGSTLVCALVRGSQALVAYLGDSRAYRLRAGELKQLTKDHSLIRLLLASGDLTPEEAATHPARGRLTRNVGMEGKPLPQTCLLKLRPGDMLLLCTDGLTGMLSGRQIQGILIEPGTLEERCRRLVDTAKQMGGEDNVTVLLVSVHRQGNNATEASSTGKSAQNFRPSRA
jgi:serine/threonine protein phosphatase PrpC